VGKFSKIKKYSKPSLSVDEKIDKLNQELKKTGMLSEIANSTSGVYTITQYTEPVPAVPPTLSDVPDISGITGNGFTQNDNTGNNTGYNDTSQLFNTGLGDNPTPIIQTPAETPAGGAGVVWHNVTLNGTAVGYIGPGNVFHQVLNPSIAGGTQLNPDDVGYYGGNYYTERTLRAGYAAAYQSVYNVPGTYITWQCWLPYNPYGFGALYSEYTGIKKQDTNGATFGLANVVVGIRPNKYTSNPGSPAQPGYTVVLTQNRLGDPNYFPGPIPPAIARGEGKPTPFTEDNYNWYNKVYGLPAAEWYRNNQKIPPSSNPFLPQGAYVPLALGPEIMNKWGMSSQAAQDLIAGALSGPRNSSGEAARGASGPYTPVKDYGGGMGYGPSGPSRDPWGGRGPLGPIPVQGV